MLSEADQDLRGLLTAWIAERGRAPSTAELAETAGVPVAQASEGLGRLAAANALLLHPGTDRPWVVHPFALSPSLCWVQTDRRGYWASCLYCGFGIAAALRCDAVITARYGGEAETVRYEVANGTVSPTSDVFHLSLPVRHWWDNVVHACATFQPFRNEEDAASWCKRHGLPLGAKMTVPALWAFAADWYGAYLERPWRKRSVDDTRALFARHGLTGAFWSV